MTHEQHEKSHKKKFMHTMSSSMDSTSTRPEDSLEITVEQIMGCHKKNVHGRVSNAIYIAPY